MDAAINHFIRALKRAGIGISPAESIDAMRALVWVTLDSRETTRNTLRATLIKDVHDAPVFEEMFDLFFSPPRSMASTTGDAAGGVSDAALPATQQVVLDTEDDGITLNSGGGGLEKTEKIQPGSLEELARNLLLKRADALLDQVMQRSTHQVNARSPGSGARPGELNFADGQPTLDTDLAIAALEQLLDDVRDIDADGTLFDQLREQATSVIDHLPEALKRYLLQQLALRTKTGGEQAKRRLAPRQQFTEAEHRQMDDIVRRLGRRMRGARSYRRVVGHHGRIHVARTLRASMIYDGIPFKPVVTHHHNEKPRIVVICDVSMSVRNTARFMLHLVYSLQSLFEQVRSFVFVSELAEASQYFEQLSIDDAIAAVLDGSLVDCDANSNYGRALGIFIQRHLACVTHHTTVIVLGDGRGNRNPPNVAALEEIRRRAKHLIWLSPEPRGSWGLGSSDMPLYEPVCHRAEVVRNLTQLGDVADALFRRFATGADHA